MTASQAIVPHNGTDFRQSTDAAGLCGAIVKQTASNIQGRRYVTVEGWQAIAIAHGCAASALDVERVNDEGMSGFRCVGVVRRIEDGQEIARGEGFLGDDERMWSKRPVYARRAMVQTRAISRACRSAFAHVVVMIDAGLSTTPAEEVPEGGFVEGQFREGAVSPDSPPNYDQEAPQEAPKRTNWGGRYPNKTSLHKALIIHQAELNRLGVEGTFDDLDEYLASPEYQDFVTTASEHAPHYLDGDRPENCPPEFVQTFALEAKARDMIAVRGNVAMEPV